MELQLFWEYEELGIQQGYILLPLIAYAAYAQYRMSFLMPGKAKKVLMDTVWRQHFIALFLILAGVIITALLGTFIPLEETLVVCLIVIAVGTYGYFLEKV